MIFQAGVKQRRRRWHPVDRDGQLQRMYMAAAGILCNRRSEDELCKDRRAWAKLFFSAGQQQKGYNLPGWNSRLPAGASGGRASGLCGCAPSCDGLRGVKHWRVQPGTDRITKAIPEKQCYCCERMICLAGSTVVPHMVRYTQLFQVEALGSSQAAALHSLSNCLYPSVPQYRLAWP